MDELKRVGVFTRVVEAQSFSEAARQLGVAKSAVSKQIALLEKEVGVRLFNRSTRRLSLTEAGEIYYRHSAEIVSRAQIAMHELREYQNQPTGTLRVSSPVSFGVERLAPVIKELRCLYPQLKIDLQLDDKVVNMVEEGIDLAIRIGWLQDSNLVAKRLCESPVLLFASPEYLAKFGTPKHPQDLTSHNWISLSLLSSPLRWQFSRDGVLENVQLQSDVKTNSVDAAVALAKNGLGISALAKYKLYEEFENGSLLPVLADWQLPSLGIYAVYPHREHLPAKVRIFMEFLEKNCTNTRWCL